MSMRGARFAAMSSVSRASPAFGGYASRGSESESGYASSGSVAHKLISKIHKQSSRQRASTGSLEICCTGFAHSKHRGMSSSGIQTRGSAGVLQGQSSSSEGCSGRRTVTISAITAIVQCLPLEPSMTTDA